MSIIVTNKRYACFSKTYLLIFEQNKPYDIVSYLMFILYFNNNRNNLNKIETLIPSEINKLCYGYTQNLLKTFLKNKTVYILKY